VADGSDGNHPPEPDARAVAAETRRLRAMQRVADRAEIRLGRGGLSKRQQARLIAEARVACTRLFPDKLYLFDIIYMPRFRRAIAHAERRRP
jgi:hypothetical protein